APFAHAIAHAPLARMLAKALIVRSSVLILPLPRIPTHRHPATTTTQAKNKMVIFFIGNVPPVIRMQRAFGSDSRKFCGFGKSLDYKAVVATALCLPRRSLEGGYRVWW